ILTLHSKPLVENRRVYLAEIDAVFQIAILKLLETRMFTNGTGLHFTAYQEHRRAGAVIRPLRAVLFRPPAKFRKRHDAKSILVSASREVLVERGDCSRNFSEQVRVSARRAALAGM